ncbi:hypothetical protein PVAND_007048 [Polypedilum vanderplanki]|uniref:Protein Jumonji n=1 Tax=Polypedilum vanderplanki TaxID=319348 RepID=A0A9J6C6P3_POLVA|nr:hypothetical protein PVAND_007048 [Polypedilum vanderplanki]
MVVSKRKKDNKEVASATPELKRTKIQAQRKFAQGQNPPSSAYLTYNLTAGNETPQREKSPERELLPNLRPNTEDFLTFLCFRGTSSLPKELDFTNSLNQPSTSGASTSSKATPDKKKQDKNESNKKKSVSVKKNEEVLSTPQIKETEKETKHPPPPLITEKDPKTGFMPFAVRKRAEVHPVKNDKKKLQPNANKKNSNNNKQQQSQKSDVTEKDLSSNGPRTTRSTPLEEKPQQNHDDSKTKNNKRKSQNDEEHNESVTSTSFKNIKLDKSPRIELTPIEKVPIETVKKDSKTNNNQVKKKSPINKKEDDKRQTRLSSLKNPASSTPKDEMKNGKQTPELKKYFSSSEDDDEPLVKIEPKNKKQKVQNESKKIDVEKIETTIKNNSINNKSQQNDTQNSSLKSIRGRKKKAASVEKEKTPEPEKSKVQEPMFDDSAEKKKVGRKKKLLIENEKANSQANTTDLSENETRGRPMRKTKEAATIYMELIGRKLTLHDSSDNDSSLDSLEVPNLKRVEFLENEMKAGIEKEKAEKKKAEEKEKKAQEAKKSNNSTSQDRQDSKNTKGKRGATREEEHKKEEKKNVTNEKSGDETKLEKSFSDSDEEPLATKMAKQSSKPTPKKRGRKSHQELAEMARKAEEQRQAEMLKQQIKKLSASPKSEENVISVVPQQNLLLSAKTINANSSQIQSNNVKSPNTSQNDNKIQKDSAIVKSAFDEIKSTPSVKVKSPETLNKSHEVKAEDEIMNDDDFFVKKFDSSTAKPASSSKPSINLLPSKEESEKIFGIASVTLAQSSGPLDTKCTLGKCGSIHKPPLGPAVLTESALGASLSPKDRRKSKVNMTREQIQKWLDEASWTPIPDDEMDSIDLKTASTSSAVLSKSGDDSQSSNQTKDKIVTDQSTTNFKDLTPKSKSESSPQKSTASKVEQKTKSPTLLKIDEVQQKKQQQQELLNISFDSKASSSTPAVNNKKTPVYQQHQQQQQRRTPVYKAVDNKTTAKSKLTPVLQSSFGAFSPENEHSIYSFDREDDDFPTPTTPFRSNSKTDDRKDEPKLVTPTKQSTTQPSHVSLTLSPDDNKKSASISVEMTDDKKNSSNSIAKPDQEKDADDSDSEGHTFYIPLQASNVSGSKTIQGVAVKLGTEGSEGPNQRIIMHAKLVTKSRINATPLPESMTNVQELVKTLMANKETSKPVQPVQPRFKSNDGTEVSTSLQPEPSTSSLVANQRTKQQAPKLGVMTEAPIFRPTEKEFQDPIEYIERITPLAQRFGICRIIPPSSFKPECRVSDEMRFTAYNQYVHKMLHRWGPSMKEFSAIKKYLATQSIQLQRPPLIAGIEVDLPRLYHTVQELGGLKEVIEKKKWAKVAEDMCIPKSAHDRITKLDDIYCKYLLPYDTLSPNERQKLFDEVEADWAKREAKARRNADKGVESDEQNSEDEDEDDEDEEEEDDNSSMECMVKGRSMALSQFYRIARNMVTLWFKTPEPTNAEIETEYWRHVAVRDSHVCVHYGSIDSSGYGYGFPTPGPKTKLSPCAKHPWNLKVLTNNCGSILRSLGPVMGVTVPTLHVGMLFSAVCWYRDPHGLPWIEYLHTGASKIWYAVPDEQSANFRAALTSLVPSHCQNKTIWLPCDTAMVPPYMLTDRNVSLCRTEQQPGQFVVVFPRAYTSSVCTGYTVSESVYFATHSWLDTAHLDFKDIQESCEPTMFSLEQLLFAIANDQRSKDETIKKILPMLKDASDAEKINRQALKDAGVNATEKIHEVKNKVNAEELECNYCRANLHISWIKLEDEEEEGDENNVYCLKHALKYIKDNRIQAGQCKLLYTYTMDEIEKLIKRLKTRVTEDETTTATVGQSSSTHDSQRKNKSNQKTKSTGK